jgi:hypothetical protein
MGTKSIRHIVEGVLDGILTAETGLAGVSIYTGDSNELNVLPKAVVICDSARAPNGLPEGLGNYACSVRITLLSNADDTTLADHRARCAGLAGAMQNLSAIKAAFTATGDATCYDVSPVSEDEGVAERSWVTTFNYDVLAVLPPAA